MSVESFAVYLKFTSYHFFFSEQPFYEKYSTLDSQSNTAIFHAVAYSTRWLPKP